MGKGSSSPPPAPDPAATAAAQGAANKEAIETSARFNQINQVTPFGSLTFSGELGGPDRTVTQSLSPENQALLQQQQAISGGLLGLGQEFLPNIQTGELSLEGLQGLPGLGDFGAERNRVEQASFDRAASLLEPQFQESRNRQIAQLEARGLPVGSEAFQGALNPLERARSQALEQASLSAVLAGGQEQSRLFNQAMSARGQGINETLLQRQLPLNELAAVLQGAPSTQLPQFQNTNQSPVLGNDVIGATALQQQAANNAFNAQSASNSSALSGLLGLVGGVGGAIFGGPAGAVAGAGIGSSLGGL